MTTFTVRRDANGHACAIERDDITILHLASGSARNEDHADAVVAALNEGVSATADLLRQRDEFRAALDEIIKMEDKAWMPIRCFRSKRQAEDDEVRHETWTKAADIARAAIIAAATDTPA